MQSLPLKFSFKEAKDLNKEYERIAKAIYNGTFKGPFDRRMTRGVAAKLTEAVLQGYNKPVIDIKFGSEDDIMVQHLLKNVYHFSAAKNHTQLKQMTELVTENGKVCSWKDYKASVDKLNIEYNKTWLNTEYNFAIASAQNASRWASFDDDAMLKYLTANDDRVRDSHRVMHGITKPKSDDFWNINYPPNGYRCRCYTIETMGKETPAAKMVQADVPPMFRTNLAKNRLVFPADHPYFKEAPPEIEAEANLMQVQDARDNAKAWAKEHIEERKSITFDVKTKIFEKLTVYRGDIKSIVSHSHSTAAVIYPLATKLNSIFDGAQYMGWSFNAGEDHQDVIKWHYFKIMVNNEPSYINVKETQAGEFRVYCIKDHFDKKKLKKKK